MEGRRNLTRTPATKHCQDGVGQEWDQVWGDRRGEEGAGDEDDTPESACDAAVRFGMIPYRGRGALSVCLCPWVVGRSSLDEFDEEW